MKPVRIIAALFLPLLAVADEAEIIQPGDWLFVKARPIECDYEKRLVDFSEVSEAGAAVLLGGLTIDTVGKTEIEAAKLLTDSVERRDGYRPESIEILRADRTDSQRQAILMLMVAKTQRLPCMKQPEQILREWKPGYRVALQDRTNQQ